VAIKHLRTGTKDGFGKVFKVSDCARSGALWSLSSHSETLSGSAHLETLIPPEHLAPAGSFCVEEPPTFPYHLRVDAQRECDGVHKVQSGGQPLAFGEFRTFHVRVYVLTTAIHSFPRSHLALRTFTNSGLRMEILKECAPIFYAVFTSLTNPIG
jgi:hypothetical protein